MVGGFINSVPICCAIDKMRARHGILKDLRAAVMIGMSMRDDDVFDLARVQPDFFHASDDLVRSSVIEQCFENDDAVTSDDCPRTVNLGAKEVEIISHLRGFGIPRISGGNHGRPSTGSSWAAGRRLRRWRRWNAEAKERPRPFESRSILCGSDKTVDRRGRSLRHGDGENDCECVHAVLRVAGESLRSSAAGKVTMVQTRSSTPLTTIPIKRNGSRTS